MPERKYKLHSSEKQFGRRSDQESIKEVLGGSLGNRENNIKKFQKSEKKFNRKLKSLKNQYKMLYSMSKCSRTRHKLKKTKKIRSKASKKHEFSSSSISGSDCDSSLSINIKLNETVHHDERKDINKLYQSVTNNINNKINMVTPYNMSLFFIINLVYLVVSIEISCQY